MRRLGILIVIVALLSQGRMVTAQESDIDEAVFAGRMSAWSSLASNSAGTVLDLYAEGPASDDDGWWFALTQEFGVWRAVYVSAEDAEPPDDQLDIYDTLIGALEELDVAASNGLNAVADYPDTFLDDEVARIAWAIDQLQGVSSATDNYITELASRASAPEPASTIEATHTIEGTLQLTDEHATWTPGKDCSGVGVYDDLNPGAYVVVLNEARMVIAIGYITGGTAVSTDDCTLAFTVEDVPRAEEYTIDLHGRLGGHYTYDAIDGAGWHVELSIGTH